MWVDLGIDRLGMFPFIDKEDKQTQTLLIRGRKQRESFKSINGIHVVIIACITVAVTAIACVVTYQFLKDKKTAKGKAKKSDKASQTDDSLPTSDTEANNNHAARSGNLCSKKHKQMKVFQAKMVDDLKTHIYPGMRNCGWDTFLLHIAANFKTNIVCQHAENFPSIFKLLQQEKLISLGKYEKLREATKEIDMTTEDVIDNATKKIKEIQDSLSGSRPTREELESQLTSQRRKYEDLKQEKEQMVARNAKCQRKYESVMKKRLERIKSLEDFIRSEFGPDCEILKTNME